MKRYIKSNVRFYHEWEVEGEFADGFVIRGSGGSETAAYEDLFDKAEKLADKHGELVGYGTSNDEHYRDGQYIDEDELTDEEDWW